ncbi:MAG: hypothetical protein EG823_02540 [Actinobacteria bacterium]|nr:hypothetical protein [Actinomycetota bacterium]
MKLSLAPLSGRCGPEAIADFYREAAECPDVDRVYIGELFCAKRLIPMRTFEQAVRVLEDAGKQVVFSTLAMPFGEADYESAAPYVEGVTTVEVNSLGFIPWMRERFGSKAITAGPLCSLYNRDDLEIVRDWGCTGVALNIALMPETVLDLCTNGAIPAEVFLEGRPPLAFSWRCYAARFAGRPQKTCGYACREQDGLTLQNLEGEPGFVVDGTAVLPGQIISTVDQALGYQNAGAAFGRLWVGPGEIAAVASAYAALLHGDDSAEATRVSLESAAAGPLRYGPVARRRLS